MARIRSIHPGLATDEAFMSMSAYAKAAWPMLWGECDDQGIFEWKPIVLKARLLPADMVDFSAIMEEWAALGVVKRFEIGGRAFGAVRNFVRFQRPKSPNNVYEIDADIRRWVGFKEDGTRPNAGTGRPSTSAKEEPLPNSGRTTSELQPQMKEEGGRRYIDAAASARETVSEAEEAELLDAAGECIDPTSPAIAVMREPIRWKGPYDWRLDVLPAIRDVAKRTPRHRVRGWEYFSRAIADWHASRTRPLPEGRAQGPPQAKPVTAASRAAERIRAARRTHDEPDFHETIDLRPAGTG